MKKRVLLGMIVGTVCLAAIPAIAEEEAETAVVEEVTSEPEEETDKPRGGLSALLHSQRKGEQDGKE